jgi:Phosphoenolpyruvate synthase/pyruvate phosphate dikinase
MLVDQLENHYQNMQNIPKNWNTTMNIQSMIFGNMNKTSTTGVTFTHNPSTDKTHLYDEFLINTQKKNIMANIRTPQTLTKITHEKINNKQPSIKKTLPKIFEQFKTTVDQLENHYQNMQNIEFTIEQNQLYILQTHNDKHTTKTTLKITVNLATQNMITHEETIIRIKPTSLNQLLHPTIDPTNKHDMIAQNLPTSPDTTTNKIIFDADKTERLTTIHESIILVHNKTSPKNIHNMHATKTILTTRGNMTNHTTIVTRNMDQNY